MNQVGELIQETVDALESGATEKGFATICAALDATLKKSLGTESLLSGDYQNFIEQHWRLLTFMGLPQALPISLAVEYELSKVVHGFNLRTAEETIFHLIRQTAIMGRIPTQFKFHRSGAIEIRANQIFIPATLIGGLVGIVIFQPVNRDQTVPDKYWINVSDFKMFVSEFWGRIDLAERIMNFYLN